MIKRVMFLGACSLCLLVATVSKVAAQSTGLTAGSIAPSGVSQLQSAQLIFRPSGLTLHLGKQASTGPQPLGDVLYIHGATFGSDLSVFFRFDSQSWADSLNAAGYTVWGFDFAGFGRSPTGTTTTEQTPIGRADSAALQIAAVVDHIRTQNRGQPVHLIAHSWGTIPAIQFAIQSPEKLAKLVLFAPIVVRRMPITVPQMGPSRLLTVWEQYRRFVEDVPKGQALLLQDRHMQAWAAAYMALDKNSSSRQPPSVTTPNGPLVDILTQWSGKALYDPAQLKSPMLIVRGQWDSLCNDQDAANLMAASGSAIKRDLKIPQATHLMHLETGRSALHQAVNGFLTGQ